MLVYRIERQKYLKEVFTGRGAALTLRNRWNSLQTPMVYTSESRSLALLEVLAYVDLFNDLPSDRLLLEISIPDHLLLQRISLEDLPTDWNIYPPNKITQAIGDAFIQQSVFPILQVPSSLVKGEYNFLLHPRHSEIAAIQLISTEQLNLNRWRKEI